MSARTELITCPNCKRYYLWNPSDPVVRNRKSCPYCRKPYLEYVVEKVAENYEKKQTVGEQSPLTNKE